jgi:hypothetical protein
VNVGLRSSHAASRARRRDSLVDTSKAEDGLSATRALWHAIEYLSEMEVVTREWSRWEVSAQEARAGAGAKARIRSTSSIGRSVSEVGIAVFNL